MPLFPDSRYFEINNSQFNDVTVNQLTGQVYCDVPGIDMLFEVSVPEAAYDSSACDPPPRCFPGTREQYVEDILNWALPPVNDTPMPIYWMKGPAGVGKSAVAQTCVEKLRQQRKLGAAFFFSINRRSRSNDVSINGRGEHYKFFTSIAYQLSTVFPKYRSLLDAKIRQDRSLINKTLASQFWGLIVEPLQELGEKGIGIGRRIPIFVDGLDECESREAQREIVEIVAAADRDGVTPLCWAFFSRPEPHIEATFSKIAISPLCRKAVLSISHDADGDIELYLKAGFEDVVEQLNIVMEYPWPADSDIEVLVHAAGGLFIYAKTVLRFVGQPDTLNPEELLRVVIAVILNRDQSRSGIEPAFAELDALYMLIMKRIPVKISATIHRILAILCWSSYSSAILIANFLGLSRVELELACGQLSSVINFQRQIEFLELDHTVDTSRSYLQVNPGQMAKAYRLIWSSLGGSLSFYHKSFQDFLLDPHRSGAYCADAPYKSFDKRARDLVLRLENYHCWQGSELVRAPGAPNSASSLSYPYENELVSSLIEAVIYDSTDGCDTSFGEESDFRKELYICTSLEEAVTTGQNIFRATTIYGSTVICQYFHGTTLAWVQPGEFPNFNAARFKEHVNKLQERNILRPCDSNLLLLNKPKGRAESGFYVLGCDSKSVFWYWEINYDLKIYWQFRTLDSIEGQRLYRENQPVGSTLKTEPLQV